MSGPMRAMVLDRPGHPLSLKEFSVPEPGPGEVRLGVRACGVCRTDLHIADGELEPHRLPVILGHEIVGRVESIGAGVRTVAVGDRIGVPWLASTCGTCVFCHTGRENLCDGARFTGYDVDGGYATHCLARADACLRIPAEYADTAAAPLLCAGLIGFRALQAAGATGRIGLYGFGAAAHLVIQIALHEGREVLVFTRPGDDRRQRHAQEFGASWVGGSDREPPKPLDAAIIFAPVGALVPIALRAVRKGGTVVCAGIHMSDIPAFAYADLWGERCVRSVANLTRQDGVEFMKLAARIPLRTTVTTYPLSHATQAVADLRSGRVDGAAVLTL